MIVLRLLSIAGGLLCLSVCCAGYVVALRGHYAAETKE